MAENEEMQGQRPESRPPAEAVERSVVAEEKLDVSRIMEQAETLEAAPVPSGNAELLRRRPKKVYKGMWGPLELAALGVALCAIVGVVLFYVLMVNPANRELQASKAERDRLETEHKTAKDRYGDISNIETEVAKLVTSVDDFEANYLPLEVTGRTALYQRINSLITGYGLVNTNGPAYAPLEVADVQQANQSESERGRAKYRSLFPGIYITMTVEGPYQNIRRFIREIETGREFVVISSVELSPSETSSNQNRAANNNETAQPGAAIAQGQTGFARPGQVQEPQTPLNRNAGRTHGEVVSLRLEMASYFRRHGAMERVFTEEDTTQAEPEESN